MEKRQEFQSVARENGYAEAGESKDGSTVWLRKATPDVGTDVHQRLCIDSITDSATVFWQTVPAKLNSKTFRTASDLKDWFGSVGLSPKTGPNQTAQNTVELELGNSFSSLVQSKSQLAQKEL